jgi:hypothetical protein
MNRAVDSGDLQIQDAEKRRSEKVFGRAGVDPFLEHADANAVSLFDDEGGLVQARREGPEGDGEAELGVAGELPRVRKGGGRVFRRAWNVGV